MHPNQTRDQMRQRVPNDGRYALWRVKPSCGCVSGLNSSTDLGRRMPLLGLEIVALIELCSADGSARAMDFFGQVAGVFALVDHLIRSDQATGVERPEVVIQKL